MTKKFADVRLTMTISFEDDGDLSLKDQAHEAALDKFGSDSWEAEIEILGEVRDKEMPAQ